MSLYTKSLGLLFVAKGLLNKPSSERVATSARNIIAKVTEELSFREQQDIKEDFLHFVQAPLHNIIVGMLSGIDLYNDLDSTQFNRLVNLSDQRLAQVLVKTRIQPPDPQEQPIPASDYLFYGAEGFSELDEGEKITILRKFFKKSRVSISTLQYLYHNIQKIRNDGKAVLINGEPAEEYVPKMILELISGVEITEKSEEVVLSRGIFKKKRKKNALSRYFSASKTSYNKIKSGSPKISIRAKEVQLLKNFSFIPHRISDIVKTEIGKHRDARSGVDAEKINLESILSESSVFDFMNQFDYEEGTAVQEELYKTKIAKVREEDFSGFETEDKKEYLEAVFNCLRYSKTPKVALRILRNNLDVVFPDDRESKARAEEAVLNRQYEKGWLSPQDEALLGSANYSYQEVQEIANSFSVKNYGDEPFFKSFAKVEASVGQLKNAEQSKVTGKILEATITFVEKSLRDHYSRNLGKYTNEFIMRQFRDYYDGFGRDSFDSDDEYQEFLDEKENSYKSPLVGTEEERETYFDEINKLLSDARVRLENSQSHPLAIRSVEGYTSSSDPNLSVGLNLTPQDITLEAKVRPLIEEQGLTNKSFKTQVEGLTRIHTNAYAEALVNGDTRKTAEQVKKNIKATVEKFLLRSEYAFGSVLTLARSSVITPLDRSRVQAKTTNFEIQERKANLYFKTDKSTLLDDIKTALVEVQDGELVEKSTSVDDIKSIVSAQGIDISRETSRVQEILDRGLPYHKKAQMLRDLAFSVKRDQERPTLSALQEVDRKINALSNLVLANPESRFIEQYLGFLHTSSFVQAEKTISLFSGLTKNELEGKPILPLGNAELGGEEKNNLILTQAQAYAKEILNVKAQQALNNPLYLLKKERAEGIQKAEEQYLIDRRSSLEYLRSEQEKEGANSQMIQEYISLVESRLDSQIDKEDLNSIGLDPQIVLVSEKTTRAKNLVKANYSEAIIKMRENGTLKTVENYNPTVERKQEEVHEAVLEKISNVIYTRVVSETSKEIEDRVRSRRVQENASITTFKKEYRRVLGSLEKASLLRARLGSATFESALRGTNFLTSMSQNRVLGVLAIAEGKKKAFSSMNDNAKLIPALLEVIGASYTNLPNAMSSSGEIYKSAPLFESISKISDSIRFFHFVLQNHEDLGEYGNQVSSILEDRDFSEYFREENRVLRFFYKKTEDTENQEFDTVEEEREALLGKAELKTDYDNINTSLKKAFTAFSADLAYLIVGGVISPESLSPVEKEASDELLALINSTSSADVRMIKERATEILNKGVSSPAIALTNELSSTFDALEGSGFNSLDEAKKDKILGLYKGNEILTEVAGVLSSANISQNSKLANYIVSGDFDLALIELEGKEIFTEIGSALTQMARRAFGKKTLYELIEDMTNGENYDYFMSLLVDYIRKNLTRLIVGLNAEVDNTASVYDRADDPELEAKVFSLMANYFNPDKLPGYLTQKSLLDLDDNRLELSYYLVNLIQQEQGGG